MKLFNMFRSPGREMTKEEVEEITKPPRIRLAETSMERMARVQKEFVESRADSMARWELEALPLILDYLEDQINEGHVCILITSIAEHIGSHPELPEVISPDICVGRLLTKEGFDVSNQAIFFREGQS